MAESSPSPSGHTPDAPSTPPPADSVLLFAVRHAEKERGIPDPGLTRAGRERADALAHCLLEWLGGTELAALFNSYYRRCRETVAPLARALGCEPTVIEAADPHRQLTALRTLPGGSAAVLCGHANTVPALLRALGAELEGLLFGMIPEACYDRVFRVLYPAGEHSDFSKTTLEVLRYGEPTR